MIAGRYYRLLIQVALASAIALVVALGLQNRSLKERHRELTRLYRGPYPGLYLPAFDAVTIDGDSLRIGEPPDGMSQTLFFFTTTCPHCRATVPAWKQIAASVNAVGVQLDSSHLAQDYVRDHGLQFPVVHSSDRRLLRVYRVVGVPLTVVVDASGRVTYSHRGRITDQAVVDSVLAEAAPKIRAVLNPTD